ncbi:hypothetical protein PF005_g23655 [Phytophthora fragariae]|uniref:Uncharacterized protein n=1 Tax=Phytophthora fragariae TaxID=53985 RepID=A0A6A3RNA0_9STRA|nr:hypothetical protein PF003_g4229 [Phytophthora fragariae]KAE8926174.1 hypothetical protein PF009_g23634 [Phytophthora fragariae]KAE9078991.1 hypothetical protein PF007_g23623 [Phytophthora fragariae]KAE9100159.1 hypothetical protein PF006_g22962 [Phytophthora fragariae]KAE9179524.1 hypothetical protein PF005_g23655 [Phytophthora fragariae]
MPPTFQGTGQSPRPDVCRPRRTRSWAWAAILVIAEAWAARSVRVLANSTSACVKSAGTVRSVDASPKRGAHSSG